MTAMPDPMQSVGFSHVTINVSDLARSVAFYEATTTLRRTADTMPSGQSFAGLGIEHGRFVGALLRDARVPLAPAVHLVQWIEPAPVGRPYGDFTHPGFFRLCFKHDNAIRVHDDALAAGAAPFTPPLMPEGERIVGRPVFSTPDPDGIVLQHLTLGAPDRLYHLACNCRDLEPTLAFFETLGLEIHIRSTNDTPVRSSFGPPAVPATYAAALLRAPMDDPVDDHASFSLDVVQWTLPISQGHPYRAQNHLGIVRLGLAVGDLEAARTRLEALGQGPGAIETIDFGTPIGRRRTMRLASPEGALVELMDRPLWSVSEAEDIIC